MRTCPECGELRKQTVGNDGEVRWHCPKQGEHCEHYEYDHHGACMVCGEAKAYPDYDPAEKRGA